MIGIFGVIRAVIPLLLALIAMVAVIYLSYLFSKYLSLGASKINGAKYMRIVDRLFLGQDKFMMVIQIGDRYYLAGVTGQNVSLMKELAGDELIEMEPAENISVLPKFTVFKEMLEKRLDKKDKGN